MPLMCRLFQVAIAQHLGLEIMRMADKLLLPFNTTHYTLQLDSYLDA
jgi:N-acetylated-alpha-linked acidic dipeptidase